MIEVKHFHSTNCNRRTNSMLLMPSKLHTKHINIMNSYMSLKSAINLKENQEKMIMRKRRWICKFYSFSPNCSITQEWHMILWRRFFRFWQVILRVFKSLLMSLINAIINQHDPAMNDMLGKLTTRLAYVDVQNASWTKCQLNKCIAQRRFPIEWQPTKRRQIWFKRYCFLHSKPKHLAFQWAYITGDGI